MSRQRKHRDRTLDPQAVIFGLDRQADTLCFRPRVPGSWTRFKLHYRFNQTFNHFEFTQDPAHKGPVRLVLDGKSVPGGTLKLVNDRREHAARVLFGP
ncbi:hypothetical protein KJ682_13680 [bacterium]|nr:hypothetical protein [bacterium]